MMHLTIRLFARCRDLAGAEAVCVMLPPGATVVELRRRVAAEYPALASLLPRCAVAVNGEFAPETQTLTESAEVALLPPVSGG
jgi:molybdopterin converting factor subunit 1